MADTIILIHGMWAGPWCWDNYRRVLEARGYRCIAVTLPYHDMNPKAAPDPCLGIVSMRDYVDAVDRQIRDEIAATGERPILIGHSMGGLIVQMLAARGLVRAAVLLTPAAPAGIMALKGSVIRSFLGLLHIWAFWRKPIPTDFRQSAYSTLHLMPPQAQREIVDKLGYESGRAIFEIGFWLFDRRRVTHVDADKVRCPMLVIGAEHDRIVPASVVRQVAHKYRRVASYRELAGHAHWVVGEPGWEAIADSVADWLAKNAG